VELSFLEAPCRWWAFPVGKVLGVSFRVAALSELCFTRRPRSAPPRPSPWPNQGK